MKATGIVRHMDDLGRICLPMELRRTFNIKESDPLEIYVDGDQIILKKYEPDCVFCGEAKNTVEINGKLICPKCIKAIAEKRDKL